MKMIKNLCVLIAPQSAAELLLHTPKARVNVVRALSLTQCLVPSVQWLATFSEPSDMCANMMFVLLHFKVDQNIFTFLLLYTLQFQFCYFVYLPHIER